jgi:glycosyltransferase involved in cell wall biosynthesis
MSSGDRNKPGFEHPEALRFRFVTLSTEAWGAETTLLTLVRAIGEFAPTTDFELVAPAGELTDTWRAEGIGPVVLLPKAFASMESKAEILRAQFKLARHLRSLPKADIVHSHHQWAHLPVAWTNRTSVSVLDLHDFVPTRPGRLIQAAAAALASHVFVASKTVQRQLPRQLVSKTSLLNRPVRTQGNIPKPTQPFRDGALRILVVCRPDPNKRLFDALGPLLERLSAHDEVVVVGGRKDEFGDLPGALSSDARLSFKGRLSGAAMEAEWIAANVHLLSSPAEPFGRVVVEAAAHGLPSIVHSKAGAADIVRATGGGLVMDSWGDFGATLEELRDPRWWTDLVDKLDAIVASHSPARVARRYLSVLRL